MHEKNRSKEYSRFNGQRGTALVMALFVITVLTVIGTMVLNTSIVEIKMAQNQKISSQVFFAAEAGLERALLMHLRDFEMDSGPGSPWANTTYSGWPETVDETGMTGSTDFDVTIRSLNMYTDANTTRVKRLTLGGGNTVNNCTFNVYKYAVSNNMVYLMSLATGNGGVAAVEYLLSLENVSPWNNAIFTGSGIGGTFNGSVNIAGSIYSIGDLNLGQNIHVANNYEPDMPGHAWSDNPTLMAILEQEMDLDSKLRANDGAITVGSASTQIGFADTPNGAIYGIYADDGFEVGSFTGTTHYYEDLQNEVPDVPMPTILDGLYAEFDEAFIYSCITTMGYTGNDSDIATSLYADWAEGTGCFINDSRGVVIDQDIIIDKDTVAFAFTDAYGNGLYYTPTPLPGNNVEGSLEIVGTVVVNGDISLGENDNKLQEVTYDAVGPIDSSGSWDATEGATLLVNGNFTTDVPFYPDDGYLKGTDPGAGSGIDFSNDINSLGVIATESVNFGSGQTTDVYAGFFYSPGQTNCSAVGKIAGTIISGSVNWNNVPDIFQVPNLGQFLPPGIPGGNNVFRLTRREWRRVY